ncbi:hypothetical protein J2X31_003726, partial [Flavobacterium arsenatis]|nr:hypothetical protein [Flavobacterium arsenatis]
MKLNTPFSVTFFILFFLLLSYQKSHSQCFQIESILVDACGPQEGLNEMVRFKVGNSALNVSNLSVVWATTSLDWQGLVQNNTTQSVVNTLNGDILDAGGCGELLQPTNGILPANATVILVTSFNMDTDLNSFGALTENIYILFQNNPNVGTGHFANSGTGTRTLTMSFGSCSDTVTYDRALLINPAGATVPADGAIVNFTPSGAATYINNDCSAPVTPFTVDVPQSTLSACAGTVIPLNGTAQGQQTVSWSAANGSFSSPNTLSTNYTIPSNAAGTTIVLTLTATNSCDLSITDTVNVIVTPSVVPAFNPIAPICFGQTLNPLPTTSNNGITGTWSPALNNSATTTYTFTPNAGQCATTATLTITVNPANTVPTFTA